MADLNLDPRLVAALLPRLAAGAGDARRGWPDDVAAALRAAFGPGNGFGTAAGLDFGTAAGDAVRVPVPAELRGGAIRSVRQLPKQVTGSGSIVRTARISAGLVGTELRVQLHVTRGEATAPAPVSPGPVDPGPGPVDPGPDPVDPPPVPQLPGTPAGLAGRLQGSQAVWSWGPGSGELPEYYELQLRWWSTSSNRYWGGGTETRNGTTFNVERGRTSTSRHELRVRAVTAAGRSGWTGWSTVSWV